MKEIQEIIRTFEAGRGAPFALATLVRARGSSYRRPGARLLIAEDGSTVGALSGGCLEEEVAVRARDVIRTGLPALLSFDTRLRYGCHGSIEILVEKARPEFFDKLSTHLRARRACLAATFFENADPSGSLVLDSPDDSMSDAFVQKIQPPLQLVLVGAGPDSAALRALAVILGWNIIEAEEASALPNEFDQWSAAVVKTHNYGRDYAALEKLLPLGLRYVALLGPRRRRDQLFHALVDEGVPVRSEWFAPAGLDIGAESPEEIALAIVAEIQATFAAGSGEPLRERKAPIHLVRALAPA